MTQTQQIDRARAAYEARDFSTAGQLAAACLDQDPDDGRAWELTGLVQYAQEEFKDSVASLERAALYVPLRQTASVCIACGYAHLGREELGCELLDELIANQQMPVSLLLQVACFVDSLNHPRLSIRACRAAAQQDPDCSQVYYDLGHYSARCGYPPHVCEALARKAISLDPERIDYRLGLAAALVKRDRVNEAYNLVAELTDDQLRQITCRCCLVRVCSLFEQAGDSRRVGICRQLAARIKSAD